MSCSFPSENPFSSHYFPPSCISKPTRTTGTELSSMHRQSTALSRSRSEHSSKRCVETYGSFEPPSSIRYYRYVLLQTLLQFSHCNVSNPTHFEAVSTASPSREHFANTRHLHRPHKCLAAMNVLL